MAPHLSLKVEQSSDIHFPVESMTFSRGDTICGGQFVNDAAMEACGNILEMKLCQTTQCLRHSHPQVK